MCDNWEKLKPIWRGSPSTACIENSVSSITMDEEVGPKETNILIHLEKMLQSCNIFLKVKIANLFLAERYLTIALFLDIIAPF